MICRKLNSEMQSLAKSYKCTYTRYVDDITFSTTTKNFTEQLAIMVVERNEVKTIAGAILRNEISHAITEQSLDAVEALSNYAERNKKVIGLMIVK